MKNLLGGLIMVSTVFIFTPVASAHYSYFNEASVVNPWPYWMGQVTYTQPTVYYIYPSQPVYYTTPQTQYMASPNQTQYTTPNYSTPTGMGVIPGTPPQTMGITPGNPGNF